MARVDRTALVSALLVLAMSFDGAPGLPIAGGAGLTGRGDPGAQSSMTTTTVEPTTTPEPTTTASDLATTTTTAATTSTTGEPSTTKSTFDTTTTADETWSFPTSGADGAQGLTIAGVQGILAPRIQRGASPPAAMWIRAPR